MYQGTFYRDEGFRGPSIDINVANECMALDPDIFPHCVQSFKTDNGYKLCTLFGHETCGDSRGTTFRNETSLRYYENVRAIKCIVVDVGDELATPGQLKM
ncbi:hypothetical protein PT974_04474 [Cladobotryum mycophilum]|uniref:Uncharacterized protein n=1 Tax=Cladobotryum mycophilum TaxID=491253 RepID=A0ABR0SV93_9HYPO